MDPVAFVEWDLGRYMPELYLLVVILQTAVLIRHVRNGADENHEIVQYLVMVVPMALATANGLTDSVVPTVWVLYVHIIALVAQVVLARQSIR